MAKAFQKRGIAFILLLFFCRQAISQTSRIVDSLQSLMVEAPDTQKVHLLNQMLWTTLYNAPDEALSYGTSALNLSKKINFKRGIANSYLRLGIVYDVTGKYDSALTHYQHALDIGKENNVVKIVGGTYNNIGLVYWNLGDLEKALDNYLKAAIIFEEMNSDIGLGNTYNNIGLIYADMKQPDDALKYYEKAMFHREKAGDEYGIGATLGNIALSYTSKLEYRKAINFHNQEIIKKKNLNDLKGLGLALNNLAINYIQLNLQDSAIINYRQSLNLKLKLDDAYGESSTRMNMGSLFLKNDKIDSAFVYLKRAETIADDLQSIKLQFKIYKDLSTAYFKMNDYPKALDYANKYAAYRDSFLNEENSKQILELKTKYETDKSLRELALANTENRVKDLELQKQKQASNLKLVIVLSILIIVSAISIIYFFRNKALQKLEMQATASKHKAERFMAVIDAQEKERKRIARELHDGLGQLLSTARLNMSGLKDTIHVADVDDRELYDTSINLIDEACSEIRNISHNMMPESLVNLGLVAALRDLAEKINRSGKMSVTVNTRGPEIKMNEAVEISLYRIMQEILNNVIRHAKADKVEVSFFVENEHLKLVVRDNGIGLQAEKTLHTAGIGWKNIYSRIEMVNGHITIHPANGGGTEVAIGIAV